MKSIALNNAIAVVLVLIAGFILAPSTSFAQAEQGHVYAVTYYKAHTGSENAYSQAWRDTLVPLFDHAVRGGSLVSYRLLLKVAGDHAESTHMIITEFADWAAYGNLPQALERASQEVFSRPWPEVRGQAFFGLREEGLTEIYMAPPPGGT